MTIQKLVLSAFLALCTSIVAAKTCTWTGGGGDMKWSTAANWENSAVPANGDTVTVNIAGSANANTNDIAGLELTSLSFTSGTSANAVFAGEKIALAANGTATVSMRGDMYTPIEIPSTATLTFNNSLALIIRGRLSGAGVVEKTGSGTFQISSNSPDFSGTWNLRNGKIQLYGEYGAFGTGIVNLYGKNLTAGTSADASLLFLRNVTFENDFNLYYDASIESRRGVTLTGDVTFHTGNASERCTITTGTDGANYGFVDFTGAVGADSEMNAGMLLLSLSHANHAIRFQGSALNLQDKRIAIDATEGTILFGCPISSSYTGTDFMTINNGVKIVMGCENALPNTANITFGTASTAGGLRGGIDLNGYGQHIGSIYAAASSATVTNRQYLTSSGGPATLTLQAARQTSNRIFCDFLNGEASIEFAGIGSGTPRFDFYGENTTSGRIISRVAVKPYLYGSFPNLKEIEVSGTGRVYVNVPTAASFNSEVEFNVHDIVEGSGYISITTGLDISVARVMYNDIDLPAAYYGKSASVWLNEGAGRCIIKSHVYRWVWTGNGGNSFASTAANWATNVAPGDVDCDVILDFSRVGAGATVNIDTTLSVEGITSGTNMNAVTVGGSAVLSIVGSETYSLLASLASPLSITYSGTGRQEFRGDASSSLGVLTVASGTVAFANGFSPMIERVSMSSGASLDLGEGVAAKCAKLDLGGDGDTEKKGTYGSTTSPAKYRRDDYFAGAGTLECFVGKGFVLIVL